MWRRSHIDECQDARHHTGHEKRHNEWENNGSFVFHEKFFKDIICLSKMADREGFEPSIRLPVY